MKAQESMATRSLASFPTDHSLARDTACSVDILHNNYHRYSIIA